ncbi:MAG TPA: ABC transporter permease [Paludibacteraceae bacterium]|nr:ABC transporter permease [Paludibacteraceae bacterium]
MNLEYFIAKRIHFEKKGEKNVSRPAVRIATIGIAVGVAVMLIAIAVVIGFKQEIRNKTIGFGSHIQITNFDNNNSYEMQPIRMSDTLQNQLKAIPNVRHIQRFVTKPGIIKTENDFQGMILKGVGPEFDWSFFKSNLIEGEILNLNDSTPVNEAIISKSIADMMGLKLGDSFLTYFLQDQIRARKFTVKGIYSTNFADYDKLFVITDIRIAQRLNGWDQEYFSGMEILITDFNYLDGVSDQVYALAANRFDAEGNGYFIQTIRQLNPQIFSWLDLLDMNVWVILLLMLAVAGFNMISGLLILILEKTNMIGILKSYGAGNWSIRKIFLYESIFLIGKGMLWGNIIGLLICFVQYQFKIIPLDPVSYYTSTVPITFNWLYIVLLNAGTLIVSVLMLIGPSYLITKISPAAIMRYE